MLLALLQATADNDGFNISTNTVITILIIAVLVAAFIYFIQRIR